MREDFWDLPRKIYLAGKIAKGDWRSTIVSVDCDVDALDFDETHDDLRFARWPVLERAIFDYHSYVGPYFIGDDHGCGHGRSSHGVGLRDARMGGLSACIDAMTTDREKPTPRRVLALCQQAIVDCDILFAWLYDSTAYGTLAEIGFASALGKIVLVAHPPAWRGKRDHWFALQMAARVGKFKTPWEALLDMTMPPHVRSIMRLRHKDGA